MKKYFAFLVLYVSCIVVADAQSYSEILGRPTDTSITISVMFDQDMDVYWEYGTTSGVYTSTTPVYALLDSIPLEADFTQLTTNTKYYYRTRYRLANTATVFSAGTEHTFHTQRPPGSSFSFAVEADPHLDTNCIFSTLTMTMQNMLAKNVDFMVDLGDNFLSEKYVFQTGTQQYIPHYQDTIKKRTVLYRSYFGTAAHSAPLFLTIGNHEGELGWKLNGTDSSMPVLAANLRKLYYPNPSPNGFYTGNDSAETFVGLREDYYAWHWGDALFIVIDPYWFTKISKRAGWGWTLGSRQFNWFKNTIRNSTAKYKFVFCHQLVGGNGSDARGGTEYADLFENGGRSSDSTWDFDSARIHWEEPLHALMIENKTSIYFHGHDHCYAKQDKDGLVYLEVPQPAAKNINTFTGSTPGYDYTHGTLRPSRGYILVNVSSDSVKVDYVKTYLPSEENGTRHNLDIDTSFVIKDPGVQPSVTYTFTGDGNWDIPSNWISNQIPPAVLPAGSSIIIDPIPGGTCLLNTTQVIATGATITIKSGKLLQAPGSVLKH